jgi:hypothetical protein
MMMMRMDGEKVGIELKAGLGWGMDGMWLRSLIGSFEFLTCWDNKHPVVVLGAVLIESKMQMSIRNLRKGANSPSLLPSPVHLCLHPTPSRMNSLRSH